MTIRPFYVAGEWRTGDGTKEVLSPYDDSLVAEIGVPSDADAEDAVQAAVAAFDETRVLQLRQVSRDRALTHDQNLLQLGDGQLFGL